MQHVIALFLGVSLSSMNAQFDYESYFLRCLSAEEQEETRDELLDTCSKDELAFMVYCLSTAVLNPEIYYRIPDHKQDMIKLLPPSLQAIARAHCKDHLLKSKL